MKCAKCGREIEPLTQFKNREGRGVVCLECYEEQMRDVEVTAVDVVTAWGGVPNHWTLTQDEGSWR